MTTFDSSSRGARRRRGSRRVLRLALIASLAATGTVLPQAGQAQTATDLRENAVKMARAGKMAEAQATLRRLLISGPDDGRVAMDLVTLLEMDGKPAEAAALFARADKPDAPAYALQAAIRANQTIGRADDNNIVLDEERVSLHHAAVVKDPAGWWLEDLGSTNGSFLRDGRKVEGRVPLLDGEEVRFGQSLLIFRGEA